MKLEIDFSDANRLRQQRKELQVALSAIDRALAELNDSDYLQGFSPINLQLPNPKKLNSPSESAEKIVDALSTSDCMDVIKELPARFTTSQAVELAKARGSNNSAIRKALAAQVEVGLIKIEKQGAGRTPTIYQKNS